MPGPAIEVDPLAIPDGEGASIPLAGWGEVGFYNDAGLLALTVPWAMAGWVQQKLGNAVVRGPESAVSLDGTANVGKAWVRSRPRMRGNAPFGEIGIVAA